MITSSVQFGFAEGIVGIIQESFLEVTHNKQDYSDNTATKAAFTAAAQRLQEYHSEKCTDTTETGLRLPKGVAADLITKDVFEAFRNNEQQYKERVALLARINQLDHTGELVQCSECLKYRLLPEDYEINVDETWYCEMHPSVPPMTCKDPQQDKDVIAVGVMERLRNLAEAQLGPNALKLLEGWTHQIVKRQDTTSSASDTYYFSADGKKFRSRPEVLKHLVSIQGLVDTSVMCDKCGKSRILPAGYDQEQLPNEWHCNMKPIFGSCQDPGTTCGQLPESAKEIRKRKRVEQPVNYAEAQGSKAGKGTKKSKSVQQHQKQQLTISRQLLAKEKQQMMMRGQRLQEREQLVEREKRQLHREKQHLGYSCQEPQMFRGSMPRAGGTDEQRFCLCRVTDAESNECCMKECSQCKNFFHPECIGLTLLQLSDRNHLTCSDHAPITVAARKEQRRQQQSDTLDSCSDSDIESHVGHVAVDSYKKPKHWPKGLKYLSFLIWDKSELRNSLRRHVSRKRVMTDIELRPLSPQHVAWKECVNGRKSLGLFAITDLLAGHRVGDYTGLASEGHSCKQGKYIYELTLPVSGNKTIQLFIDAGLCGNETRFVNHFEGVAKSPNCKFIHSFNERSGEPIVEIRTIRRVEADEELLLDYGPQFTKENMVDD